MADPLWCPKKSIVRISKKVYVADETYFGHFGPYDLTVLDVSLTLVPARHAVPFGLWLRAGCILGASIFAVDG